MTRKWIAAVAGLLVLAILFYAYLGRIAKKAEADRLFLEGKNAVLQGVLRERELEVEQRKKEVAALKLDIQKAEASTQKALQDLKNAKKPIIAGPVEDPEQVFVALKTYYDDSTATFLNEKYSICKKTTSLLVGDAVNWKVNAPIYEDTIQKSAKALNAAFVEIDLKGEAISKQDVLIKSFEASNVVREEILKNANDRNNAISKELKVVKRRSKLEKIGVGAAAFLAGCLVERHRRR